ncbi:hypothetical protein JHK87_008482 [Glycine soja]|nr:hypothetical protein JHK87_008482 [Glycine soja]
MVTDGTKKPQVSVPTPPPPWKINLQKYAESRALELHSLQSIIENRVNSDYRSQKNKRRRKTVFDNQIARKGCRRKRQKLGIIDKALAKSGLEENHQKKLPRCVHRRYELKKNPENGFCTSGDVTKRLRTHVWHAKWFAMTKLWAASMWSTSFSANCSCNLHVATTKFPTKYEYRARWKKSLYLVWTT